MIRKILLIYAILTTAAVPAYIDTHSNRAKTALVRKIYQHQTYLPYASPELKRIVRQSELIINRLNRHTLECGVFTHKELGFGQDFPENYMDTLKIRILTDNKVRADFRDFAGKTVHTVFDISCTAGSCQINDIINHAGHSAKQTRRKIIRTRACS